jgi:hypothetical protein
LCDGLPISSCPSNCTEPLARGGVNPMIAAQRVDFPMPLRPMIATDSLPIENVTPWRTAALA